MEKKYTIGLDIGTNSVGWAVIDENFNLVKGKKHINDNGNKRKVRTNLWGAELFDEGEPADERRIKRGGRRRIKRRHERINYLRGIFEEEILKVDESFFIRLDESFFQMEDKKKNTYHYRDTNGVLQERKIDNREIYKYPLFINEDDEKKYYEDYPTIYHLRNYLMESDEKADIRLVYLALHHIIKYRGHFTNQGQTFDFKNKDVARSLQNTLRLYGNAVDFNFGFDENNNEDANNILNDAKSSKSQKAYKLSQLYKIEADTIYLEGNEAYQEIFETLTEKQKSKYLDGKQKQVKALFTAIVGNKIDLEKIFGNSEYKSNDDNGIPKSFYYKDEDFDATINTLESVIDPSEMEVLLEGKKVYESIILSGIMTEDSLSASMVAKYKVHKKQLKELKTFANNRSRDLYVELFGKDGVYSRYIQGSGNPTKKTGRDDFYKEIKETLRKYFDGLNFPNEDKEFDWSGVKVTNEQKTFIETMLDDMNADNYLPKQRMSDNGAIPYQVHEDELIKIIEKQGKYYPFLLEKSENEYKIQTLMKFRIPYYVGPLTEANVGELGQMKSDKSSFAWMQKQKEGKITPWNFDEIVDKDASSIEFIERMTSFCTYLPSEKVLAKNTLLYQEFCVYNELIVSGYYENRKKYRFGDDSKLLNDLVNDLFKNGKSGRISQETVINYLENEKGIHADELFGIDKRSVNGKPSFNNCLSSYHDLKNMGIEGKLIDDNRDLFDEIITWQTVFTDKKSLKKRLERANEEWQILDDAQIEKLSNKHYTGFGSLSKKLIDGIRDRNSGWTIIETLKNGGYDNFMRLISGETAERYTFKSQIEEAQTENLSDSLTYDIVDQLAGSPKIKKGIWQSLKILKELEKYLHRENIDKIVIEMSRGNDGGRTKSRYKQLLELYKTFEDANKEVFDELKTYEKKEKAFDNEKLHLYFRQNGIDAYDYNNSLKIDCLSDYEVDHIIPQSFLKDDSIDNKVLVSKISNQQKGGDVPSREIVNSMRPVWESWVKAGLMSQKKFKHLTTLQLNDKVKEGFINRQLVENRQITKHVANILSKYYEGTETIILTPKASLTSQFRSGKIYLPNPEFNQEEAKKNPKEYNQKRFIEEKLHNGFPKNRDLNDYHHAHDAYLNAIVALYIYRKNPSLRNIWVYGEYQRKYEESIGRWVLERKNKSLQLLSDMREAVWEQTDPDTGEIYTFSRDEVMANIEKTLDYHNVNVVKKTERQLGKFGKEEVLKKDGEKNALTSKIKNELPSSKYGGRQSLNSAFLVVVKDDKDKILCISIDAIDAESYLSTNDKLECVRSLFPEKNIKSVIVQEVKKYTKFANEKDGRDIVRLVASDVESQKADSLVLTLNDMRGLLQCKVTAMNNIFDKITNYLTDNQAINENAMKKWENEIKTAFDKYTLEEKKEFINSAFTMTKRGTTDPKGVIGESIGRQRHKSAQLDRIRKDTVLIYQSVTGLYEKRLRI